LIGNGWIDPRNQYPAYLSYAYASNILVRGSEKAEPVERELAICKNVMENEGIHVNIDQCEAVLNVLLRVTKDEYSHFMDGTDNSHAREGCLNMYDVRLHDAYPSCGMAWPPDLKDVTPYLRVFTFASLLTAASRCSKSVKHRYTEEKTWLARMFRDCYQQFPGKKFSTLNYSSTKSPRTDTNPPLQWR
jgi:carboxypeptidase C (cathepsin A)